MSVEGYFLLRGREHSPWVLGIEEGFAGRVEDDAGHFEGRYDRQEGRGIALLAATDAGKVRLMRRERGR